MIIACIIGLVLIFAGVLNFLSYAGIDTYYLSVFIASLLFLMMYFIIRKKWSLYFSYLLLPLSLILFSSQFFTGEYLPVICGLIVFAPALSFYLIYTSSRKKIFKYLSVISAICTFVILENAFSDMQVSKFFGATLLVFACLFALFHIADFKLVPNRNLVISILLYLIGTNVLLRAYRIISRELFAYGFTGILVVFGLGIIIYVFINRDKTI
jgi:hypothetical protein